MEAWEQITEEMRARIVAAHKARDEFYAAAVLLADAVVKNRATIHDPNGTIRGPACAFISADERYTNAVKEATAVCGCISKRLFCLRNISKGGAK